MAENLNVLEVPYMMEQVERLIERPGRREREREERERIISFLSNSKSLSSAL
jgi:hypothetical protein